MGIHISKKSINYLRLKIFDEIDRLYISQEGKPFDKELVRELKSSIENVINVITSDEIDTTTLNERHYKVIEYLKNFKEITRREYSTMFGISFMTSFRDLAQLEKKGLLIKIGKGRATKYLLK